MKKTARKPKRPPAVSDHRWAVALDAADRGNLRELLRALLIVAPLPTWVRETLTPSLPHVLPFDERPLKDSDRRLILAAKDFRERKGGKRLSLSEHNKLLEIVAKEHGMRQGVLNRYLGGKHRANTRVRSRIPSA